VPQSEGLILNDVGDLHEELDVVSGLRQGIDEDTSGHTGT
jgi:hypothetical protein